MSPFEKHCSKISLKSLRGSITSEWAPDEYIGSNKRLHVKKGFHLHLEKDLKVETNFC
jgi:hypothetical protein